ncbi:hypothetical protein DRO61_00830 [Candidatus Bathyarchaeota archaeon]|nr:MAG: hypothetical protein DRO61_00830 [Candidatus Bathyarchaeota archaeon]
MQGFRDATVFWFFELIKDNEEEEFRLNMARAVVYFYSLITLLIKGVASVRCKRLDAHNGPSYFVVITR